MSRRGLIGWLAAAVTLTGVLVAVVAVPGAGAGGCDSPPFPDVATSNEFCADIAWLSSQKITTGYGDGDFHPTRLVTRQEMAAFLYRYKNPGSTPAACASVPFSDVPVGGEFCGEIQWLSKQGIASGYGDGTFHPKAPIARQEMAQFLYKLTVTTPGNTPCDTALFSDVTGTNPFCAAITWLAQNHITNGNSNDTFAPTLFVARQEMAAFLHRLYEFTQASSTSGSGSGGQPGGGGSGTGAGEPGNDTVLQPGTVQLPASVIQSVAQASGGSATITLQSPSNTAAAELAPDVLSARLLTASGPLSGAPGQSPPRFGDPCTIYHITHGNVVLSVPTANAPLGLMNIADSVEHLPGGRACVITGPHTTLDHAYSSFDRNTDLHIGALFAGDTGPTGKVTLPLGCTGTAGLHFSVQADFSNTQAHFEFHLNIEHPTQSTMRLAFTVAPKVTFTAKFDGTVNCSIKGFEGFAARMLIPGSPLVLAFKPDFSISATGSAKVSATWTPRLSLGIDAPSSNHPDNNTATLGEPTVKSSGAVTLQASFLFDASLLAGGVAGIEAKIGPQINETFDGPAPCGSFGVHLNVSLVADILLTHWSITLYDGNLGNTATIGAGCGNPVIATTQLPDGTVGVPYVAELTTADHRHGTWQIVGFSPVVGSPLPPGLSLSYYTISGTPTSTGRYAFELIFTDDNHRQATATVSITILPASAPLITASTYVDQGIALTYIPPSSIAADDLVDYICRATPDGGTTVYPCDSNDGYPSGVGTGEPAIASAFIYYGPGNLQITPGWSIAMAAVTLSGAQQFGPWFRITYNPLQAPTISQAIDGSSSLSVYFKAPAAPGLTIRQEICEVSPDAGATVYTCNGGADGTLGSMGLDSPAQVPNTIYIGPGNLPITPGWSIRMWSVAASVTSPKSPWVEIT